MRARPHATSSALRLTAHINPGAIVDGLCPAQVRSEPGPVGRLSLARLPRDAKEAWELTRGTQPPRREDAYVASLRPGPSDLPARGNARTVAA